MRSVTQVPSPGSLVIAALPPWRDIMLCTIARPSPVPLEAAPVEDLERDASARKKRSKTLGSASDGMPAPVSETWMHSSASAAKAATVTEPPLGVWAMALETRLLTARSISGRSRAAVMDS